MSRPNGATRCQPKAAPWVDGYLVLYRPVGAKALCIKSVAPSGRILPIHTIPRAMPRADCLLALQAILTPKTKCGRPASYLCHAPTRGFTPKNEKRQACNKDSQQATFATPHRGNKMSAQGSALGRWVFGVISPRRGKSIMS